MWICQNSDSIIKNIEWSSRQYYLHPILLII